MKRAPTFIGAYGRGTSFDVSGMIYICSSLNIITLKYDIYDKLNIFLKIFLLPFDSYPPCDYFPFYRLPVPMTNCLKTYM